MHRRLVAIAVFVAEISRFSAFASADDNLLGLPEPLDEKRPGAVMLHGGGRLSDDTFDRFLELAGGRDARIIFVPSAGYRVDSYVDEPEFLRVVRTRYSSWAALPGLGKVKDFRFVYTDNPADAENADFVKPLENATGVWFSGGFQSRLSERYVGRYPNETRFQKALRSVVARGGVVGGTSAGMAAMPLVITLWEDRVLQTSPAAAVAGYGFGLLTRTIVEQHFDARGGRLERFTGLLRDNARLDALAGERGVGEKMIGLAVEEHTAVIAQVDQLEVRGENRAHVFFKTHGGRTVTWHEMASGDSAKLKCDVPEQRRDPEFQLVFDPGTPPSNASAAK
jgi:cyanophycinase